MTKTILQNKLKWLGPRFSVWHKSMAVALVFGILLTGVQTGLAKSGKTGTYEPPPVSNRLSRGIQGILGMNALAGWVGSRMIKSEIQEKVKGDVHVKLRPFSAFDLMSGKARSLEIEGRNLVVDEAFYISAFTLYTDKDTPLWVDTRQGKIKSPVEADVSVRITPTDLNRSFQTPDLRRKLERIKIPLAGGSQTIALLDPKVLFKPGRIRFNTRVSIASNKNKFIPLDIETGLEPDPKNNRIIRFKDIEVAPIPGVDNMPVVEEFLEVALQRVVRPSKLVPLDGATLKVRTIQISPREMHLAGRVKLMPQSDRKAHASGVQ